MNQFEIVLNRAINYSKNLLSKRNDDKSLLETLEYCDQSALDLYNHLISTMIHFSNIKFENFDTSKVKPIVFDVKDSITDQLLELFDEMSEKFSKCIEVLSKQEIDEHQDFIGVTVMHTVTHLGQALRLQKIALKKFELAVELQK